MKSRDVEKANDLFDKIFNTEKFKIHINSVLLDLQINFKDIEPRIFGQNTEGESTLEIEEVRYNYYQKKRLHKLKEIFKALSKLLNDTDERKTLSTDVEADKSSLIFTNTESKRYSLIGIQEN